MFSFSHSFFILSTAYRAIEESIITSLGWKKVNNSVIEKVLSEAKTRKSTGRTRLLVLDLYKFSVSRTIVAEGCVII